MDGVKRSALPRGLAYSQIVLQSLALGEFLCSSAFRWRVLTPDVLVDSIFAFVTLVSSIGYTVIVSMSALGAGSPPWLLALDRIPLHIGLTFNTLSQARWISSLIGRPHRLKFLPWITVLLGSSSIAMLASQPLSREITTPCGLSITGITLLTEVFLSLYLIILIQFGDSLTAWRMRSKRWQGPRALLSCVAFGIRALSSIITALMGGYYLHTFLSPLSWQTVACQQINLFLSTLITRRAFDTAKAVENKFSEPSAQLSSAAPLQSSDSLITRRPTQTTESSVNTGSNTPTSETRDTTNQSLERSKRDTSNTTPAISSDRSLHRCLPGLAEEVSESSASTTMEISRGHTISINRHRLSSIMAQTKSDCEIIGMLRKMQCNVQTYQYLVTQPMMTVHESEPESDELAEYASEIIKPANGYIFMYFEPKWLSESETPASCEADCEAIKAKISRLSDFEDEIEWDGNEERLHNITKGFTYHLCLRWECETCETLLEHLDS